MARKLMVAGVVSALGLTGVLAGCAGGPGQPPAPDSSTSATWSTSITPTWSATVSPPSPNGSALATPEAGRKLCTMMAPALSEWRVQTPTPDKVAFNIMVQQWALGIGSLGGSVSALRNKSVVDQVTQQSCPDIRQQAIEAFDVSDLSDALVGG